MGPLLPLLALGAGGLYWYKKKNPASAGQLTSAGFQVNLGAGYQGLLQLAASYSAQQITDALTAGKLSVQGLQPMQTAPDAAGLMTYRVQFTPTQSQVLMNSPMWKWLSVAGSSPVSTPAANPAPVVSGDFEIAIGASGLAQRARAKANAFKTGMAPKG